MKLSLQRLAAGSVLLALLASSLAALERTRITVLSTTDIHSHVAPIDYFTNKPVNEGLAVVSTLVKQARKADPELLLIDVGDTIQGTPLGYFHARRNPAPIDPTILAMNTMGYVSMTVGNHEFNFGRGVLHKAQSEAKFPWLSANIVRKADQSPLFTPYIIKEVKGVRVAILGLTTAGIPYWENAETINDLDFLNPTQVAARYVRELREKEKADVVIIAMHMGIEEDLSSGATPPGQVPAENTALEISRSVPGIDLVLLGHTHRAIPALIINNTLIAQPGNWGNRLGQADLYLEREAAGKPWKVFARASQITQPTLEADPQIMALVKPYHDETQAWLDKPIGTCAEAITAESSREGDSALIDLVHRVQLEAGKADISFAASFNPRARVPKGQVTVRDIYSLYTYENTLAVIELSGQQIKDALEHAARFYRVATPGATLAELIDPRIPGYNFDTAEGIDYELDLSKPLGERVQNLRRKGTPLDLSAKFRVATNNYRQNGGGGYRMFREAKVIQRGGPEIRDLIIEWIEKHHDIPATATANWSILPLPRK